MGVNSVSHGIGSLHIQHHHHPNHTMKITAIACTFTLKSNYKLHHSIIP